MRTILTTITPVLSDYEFLDAGDGEKLERYGSYVLRRPDPQALWPKTRPDTLWHTAHGQFIQKERGGSWRRDSSLPERWNISIGAIHAWIKPTAFKHTGLFPEHFDNWQFIADRIASAGRPISVLNLFGYTGAATIAASCAGAAHVCHVDSSKSSVLWARENAELSGLSRESVRWIVDDARKFVSREIKRGVTYDAIIMDPPAFGRGADGEVWNIEDDFIPFLSLCQRVLSSQPLFVVLNGYAAGYSAIAYGNDLDFMMKSHKGDVEIGEMGISNALNLVLPCGIFARWSASS